MTDTITITRAEFVAYQAAVELANREARDLAQSCAKIVADWAAAEADNAALIETLKAVRPFVMSYGIRSSRAAEKRMAEALATAHPGAALLTALAWYADVSNYGPHGAPGTTDPQEGTWHADAGDRARAALEGRAE